VAVLSLFAFAGADGAAVQNEILAEGPACPIPNPIEVAGPIPINITLDPLVAFKEGSEVTNLAVRDADTLKYTYNIVILPPGANIDLTLTKASGSGDFVVSGYLDATPFRQETIPSGDIEGKGNAKISIEGLHVKGKANLRIKLNGKVEVTTVTIDILKFDAISVDFGTEMTIGGKVIDWATLSANLKANFDKDFADHGTEIVNKIKGVVNGILGEFTLQELLDIIKKLEERECEA
jgi:hypothetical protein